MLRLVIDTDVMVAAFESRAGASRQVLLDALDGKVALLLSTGLLLEYEAVLTRQAALDRRGLCPADIIEALDDIAGHCIPVVFDYRWRPLARDADDDIVLETAINGTADLIATFNLADMADGAAEFGIVAERPGAVLRRIRG